ncbi:hypothetical protein R1flu_025228 [Riccia fluitans]|uniref:Large ribosomal subunit protein uL29m n=1 Tax=Riccia fluitans TaxID=41844 RepID=A0ABD1XX56_9MARC
MQVARTLLRPLLRPSVSHNQISVRPSSGGGLAEFFEVGRDPKSTEKIVYGRSWKASELRLKSWDDLHKLWYVLLKEKNMLLSQKQMLNSQNLRMPNPERFGKVRKSMCRLKQVLTERALEVEDRTKRNVLKRMINSM